MKKRIRIKELLISASVALSAVAYPCSFASANDESTVFNGSLGDVNMDSSVTTVDAALTLGAYAELQSVGSCDLDEFQLIAADVNEDGAITPVDAALILSYYAYGQTTGNDITMDEFLSSPQLTATSTTTTTTNTTTTTTTVTTTTDPVEHPYSLQEITTNVEAFEYYADKLNLAIMAGITVEYFDADGNKITTNGYDEANVVLAVLNKGYINDEVLREVLSGYNAKQIKDYLDFCVKIPRNMQYSGATVDFNKYVLDSFKANEMNYIASEARKVINGGDSTNYNAVMNSFFITGDYNANYLYDPAMETYMIGWNNTVHNALGIEQETAMDILYWEMLEQDVYPYGDELYNIAQGHTET